MTSGIRIIQFPHPGVEHVPKDSEMGWNVKRHRRKFLVNAGRMVVRNGSTTYEGLLTFWGEWEPPSSIKQRWKHRRDYPTVLHKPYWIDRAPVKDQQNTDPWIFGSQFLYSNCKQITPKGNPSAMQELTPGSMILFGSTLNHRFLLDTVFVVGEILSTFRPIDFPKIGSDAFQACTIRSLASLEPRKSEATFTLFVGASPEKPFGGMFSFTPSRRASNPDARFPRPNLKLHGVINPFSTQSPRGVNVVVPSLEVHSTWLSVVEQVESHELELGTNLEVPPQK